MKHLFFTLLLFFQSGVILAQDDPVTLTINLKNLNLEEAFERIEEQTSYRFSYISEFLPETNIRKNFRRQSIDQILNNLLADHDLLFDIREETIIIYRDGAVWDNVSHKEIYGTIQDRLSGELLIGANIYSGTSKGVVSNDYGYYAIGLDQDMDSLLTISYIGYNNLLVDYKDIKNGNNNYKLNRDTTLFDPVVITKKNSSQSPFERQVGEQFLSQYTANKYPGISGEGEILNNLAEMPGVLKLSEGKSGYTVHGASSDHNLILIDEAPVYNPSHALGFVSVFNTEAVNSGRLYTAYISPQYGGRIASVLSMHTREGHDKHLRSTIVANSNYSGLTLEGPVVGEKFSFLVSGRISHFNWLLDEIEVEDQFYTPEKINFYDIHAKLNFNLGKNNRFYFSTFINEDEIIPKEDTLNTVFFSTYWKNRTLSMRWNRLWGNKVFSNLSIILSEYEFQVFNEFDSGPYDLSVNSNIDNTTLKLDFNYYPNDRNVLKFGLNVHQYKFNPASGFLKVVQPFDTTINYEIEELISLENSLFIEHQWDILDNLKLQSGLRFTSFMNMGNDNEEFDFDAFGRIQNSYFYPKGEIIRTYKSLEPRISMQYVPWRNFELGLAYSRTSQNIFRLLNENPNNPTETWLPAGKHLKPMKGDGWYLDMNYSMNDQWNMKAGLFLFHARNVATYKQGSNLFVAEYLDQQITQGDLRSKGFYVDLRFDHGSFNGLASYTYTLARQRFDQINDGAWFNATHDYTHAILVNGRWSLGPKLAFNLNWLYHSGNFISLPDKFIYYNRFPFEVYSERNNYRLPDYHRLDLSLNGILLQKTRQDLELTAGVYNLYGRLNPFQVNVNYTEDKANLKVFALTSAVPFITLKLRFKPGI